MGFDAANSLACSMASSSSPVEEIVIWSPSESRYFILYTVKFVENSFDNNTEN